MDKCLTAGSDPPAIVSGGTGFFCNTGSEEGCTSDRSAAGHCSVITHDLNPIDYPYRYFPSSSTGGGIEASDYCPYVLPDHNRKCIDTHSSPSGRLDIFSSTSKCFESTIGGYSEGGACYRYSCSSTGALSITVGTSFGATIVTCTTGGEQMHVSDIVSFTNGYVRCPVNITTLCGTHHYSGTPSTDERSLEPSSAPSTMPSVPWSPSTSSAPSFVPSPRGCISCTLVPCGHCQEGCPFSTCEYESDFDIPGKTSRNGCPSNNAGQFPSGCRPSPWEGCTVTCPCDCIDDMIQGEGFNSACCVCGCRKQEV